MPTRRRSHSLDRADGGLTRMIELSSIGASSTLMVTAVYFPGISASALSSRRPSHSVGDGAVGPAGIHRGVRSSLSELRKQTRLHISDERSNEGRAFLVVRLEQKMTTFEDVHLQYFEVPTIRHGFVQIKERVVPTPE